MNVSLVPNVRMNVDEFFAWSERQPDDDRYELVDGAVVVVARQETIRHNLAKGAACRALDDAVRAAGVGCPVFIKGIGVAINDNTLRLPDVVIQSRPGSDWDAMLVERPLIVVEVASGARNPIGSKFIEYFSVESIRRYLISVLNKRAVIHHRRNQHGTFDTRIVRDGDIVLDPPGLSVSVAAFLGEEV
jgi:Uma2 family endonuclease